MNLCQMQSPWKSRLALWRKRVLINHHGHKEVFQCVKLSEPLQNLGMQHVWNCQTSGIVFGIHQHCGYNNRYFAFALAEVFCRKWVLGPQPENPPA